jgi:hypothetical protein
MARCQFKTGLLSLRECGELTGSRCAGCGRAVCSTHARWFVAARGGGVACPDCIASDVDPTRAEPEGPATTHTASVGTPAYSVAGPSGAAQQPGDAVARLRRTTYRDDYGTSSGYGSCWHDHDYDTFDAGTSAAAGAAAGAVDPRDFQDS